MMKRRIEGHGDAVLCCQVLQEKKLLVSGGEDAQLCFTDLRTLTNAGRLSQSHGEAVTSVCSCPTNEHLVFASAGQAVLTVDLRKGLTSEAISEVWTMNQDEVNHIAVNRQGSWLAAADDSGEVQVVSLQLRDSSGRPAYKTLRRGHSNICSTVAFRPHRPWELLSGGLDSTVVRWDFNRLRPQQSWNLNAEAAAGGGQVFNPPMVHSVVVPDTEDRSLCRLMAVGRGDGYISLYDIDSKPALPPGAGSKGSGSGGGSASGGGSKKSGKGKQKGGARAGGSAASAGGGGDAAVAASAAAAASSSGAERSSHSSEAAAAETAAAEAPDPWQVPFVPGRVGLLGREHGGHTAAVNCLSFLHGSDWQRLLSAGNDGRLLLWDWRAAAARQGWQGGEARGQSVAAGDGAGGSSAAGSQQQSPGGTTAADEIGGEGAAVAAAVPASGAEGAAAVAAAARASGVEGAAAVAAEAVVTEIKHGRKINWVCSCEPVGGYNVFVADVTRRMTALALC